MNVHVIIGGAVRNTVIADSVAVVEGIFPGATCVADTGEGAPGWLWDGATLRAPGNNPVIGALDYLARFTTAETAAIHGFMLTAPPTADSLSVLNSVLRTSAAGSVDLAGAEVTAGHAKLVALGLLSSGRSAEILTP